MKFNNIFFSFLPYQTNNNTLLTKKTILLLSKKKGKFFFFFFVLKKMKVNYISYLAIAHNPNIINRSEIRSEQSPVPLSGRTRLKVLIKQREKVGLESPVGHQRRAPTRAGMPDQVPIKRRRIGHATGFVAVAVGGPTGLAHDQPHVAVPDGLHGRVEGVHHGVEHVGVRNACELVVDARVALEERVVRHLWRVGEVGVGVDHEGCIGLA
jgi:hypothetical protein